VLHAVQEPLVVEDVDIGSPGPGAVQVRVVASGVCHTDYSAITGAIPLALPSILGHEGAGIVEEVGIGVTAVRPGDHVVLSWAPYCGRCFFCANGKHVLCENRVRTFDKPEDSPLRLHSDKSPVSPFVLGTFAERVIVPEISCVKIPDELPLDKACLLGCAVMTGVGAAINTAQVTPGSSAVIFGCGGIGLNIIQGCSLAGAEIIIGVDLQPNKLDYALQFGATHTLNGGILGDSKAVEAAVRELTHGRGADYAFEAIGRPQTIEQAFACTRQGGTTVVVGAPRFDETITLPAFFMHERIIKGCNYGSSQPHRDLPRLVGLYLAKRLKLDELVSRTFPLSGVNEAFELMKREEVARSVLLMPEV